MRHQGSLHSTRKARRVGASRRIPVFAALVVLLSGCSTPVYPPITAHDPGDAAFKARIAREYPVGTPAARLRADLAGQGFSMWDDPVRRRFSALVRSDNLPCYSQVRIDWTEDRRGRITEIQAQRHDCT